MTFRTLIRRCHRFHWRSHLGVVLGAAVGSAALIGALVVGDSVKGSLRERALAGLGHGSFLLRSQDRYFSEHLPARIRCQANLMALMAASRLYQKTSSELPICINPELPERGMLVLSGTVVREDASRRLNRVQIIGVSDFSPVLFSAVETARPNAPRRLMLTNVVVVNAAFAANLGVSKGDVVLVRFEKASTLSSEVAISSKSQPTATLRLIVHSVSTNGELANFSPDPAMTAPANIFVPLSELARAAGLQEVREVSYLVAEDRPSDGSDDEQLPASETRTERIELNLINTMLTPEIVALQRSPRRPQAGFGARLDEWTQWLKRRLNLPTERDGTPHVPVAPSKQLSVLSSLLKQSWDFDAVQIARWQSSTDTLGLTTERIFLDPPIARSTLAAATNAQPILTYLATLLRVSTNYTPYSMVTAVGVPWTPADMRDDEIVVSQWLADDLHVKPGDEIAMSYFLPESGANLEEATNTFRVRSIVPSEMPWADRTLMPDFPGIEKAESTSDWDAGFPLTYKIRAQDEEYWKKYRGTPKAFVTLAAGQKMWANRFGDLPAIRFPIPTNAPLTPALSPSEEERENRSQSPSKPQTADRSTALEKSSGGQPLLPLPGGEGRGESGRNSQTNQSEPPHVVAYKDALEKKILANLKPEELGLRFEPVREQALQAAEQSQDFGGLFLGFSFFVIAAALLLMALLFQLSLEQRAPEIGTLLALGFTPKQVRRLLLGEGVALAFVGGLLGAAVGLAYARVMLHGLTTIWRDAVGETALSFHFTAQTLVIGLFASVAVSAVTIWLNLRKFVRRPARELLAGEIQEEASKVQSQKSKVIAVGASLAGLGLVGWAVATGDTANAGVFFGAGALVLVAGLSFVNAGLARLSGAPVSDPARKLATPKPAGSETGAPMTLAALAVRGCARRRKRSLATVAMLACGSFLIVSIGVFRLDAKRDATKKDSGTGGFALIGETTMPVVHDLNTPSGRDFFALDEKDLAGVSFVPFRVRDGDEASCLNLNAAQRPRLLGVKPEILEGRFAFSKVLRDIGPQDSWSLIAPWVHSETGVVGTIQTPSIIDSTIPAIGDANSIQWAMHKKVGDTIDYVDERGQPFKVRIVGAVANSILQGQLIIDEAEFVKRFPGESGYRMFLMDAPSNTVSQVSATLSRAMQDVGLELTPAAQRLAQFNAVQNTYLGTFQVLGGLGLLLGSVGLGIVVLRNVLERRGELAVLLAVGFRKQQLQQLLLIENGALLALGLALGVLAAAVAVLPALLSPSSELPYTSLALTLGAVLVNGAVWTWAATRVAVRGNVLAALRNE